MHQSCAVIYSLQAGSLHYVLQRLDIREQHADAGSVVDGADGLGEQGGDGDDFDLVAEWFESGFDRVGHEHLSNLAV